MWANAHLTIARFTPQQDQPSDFIEMNRLAGQRLSDLFMLEDVSTLLSW
jgi:hypothetical protein